MSREIKFRAWDPKNKKMQTTTDKWAGDVFIRLNGEKVICTDTGEWEQGMSVSFTKDVLDLILMQFTGLKDNKGKDIYEGDIVGQFEDEDNLDYEEKPSKWLRVIEWNDEDGAWGVMNKEVMTSIEKLYEDDWDEDYCFASDIREMEVIGNIYENPELK